MTVKELKEIITNIDSEYDDLNVWFDTEYGDGGRMVQPLDISITNSDNCCLDGDGGCEYLTEDEILDMFMLTALPEPGSLDFMNIIRVLNGMGYDYSGKDDLCGHRFDRKILAIKF